MHAIHYSGILKWEEEIGAAAAVSAGSAYNPRRRTVAVPGGVRAKSDVIRSAPCHCPFYVYRRPVISIISTTIYFIFVGMLATKNVGGSSKTDPTIKV